ncbi:MAG: FtsQ-type POTRA domain-containing protein [Deinococcus sp.]|nr:FtsQ-type POTRA domain-containing protein [Deinococcus sp.]
MFRRSPPGSRPVRKKWHPDDEETVLHDGLDDPDALGEPEALDTPGNLDDLGALDGADAPGPAAHASATHAPGQQDGLSGARAPARSWEPPLSQAASELPEAALPDLEAAAVNVPPVSSASRSRVRSALSRLRRRPAEDAATASAEAASPGAPAPEEPQSPGLTYLAVSDPILTDAVVPAPSRAASRHRAGVRWGWVFLPLAMLGLAASWFALPIREVEVSGHRHLSAAEVVQAAGVGGGSGWLYYGARQASGLTRNPWIESAEVTRQFPDRLRVQITERRPYAVLRESGQPPVAVARDGTRLPGAELAATLPTVSGWGPERTGDALTALEALAPYHVQSVEYTPSGLSVKAADSSAWSGDLESLLKYAGALTEYPNQQIHIYPWGVSVQE